MINGLESYGSMIEFSSSLKKSYFLLQSSRKELASDIEDLKKKIAGTE